MGNRTPIWVRKDVVLATHGLLIAEFGGTDGDRDDALLESALGRPEHKFSYEKSSVFDLAASYAFGIARNHPFVDGNKRTAFMVAYIFLRRNGSDPRMDQSETVSIMNAIAAGDMTEKELAIWFADNCLAARQ